MRIAREFTHVLCMCVERPNRIHRHHTRHLLCVYACARTCFRWLDYTPMGKRIEGTRFIAFKVPLQGVVSKTSNAVYSIPLYCIYRVRCGRVPSSGYWTIYVGQ